MTQAKNPKRCSRPKAEALLCAGLAASIAACSPGRAAPPGDGPSSDGQPTALEQPDTPRPAAGTTRSDVAKHRYRLERAFPALTFERPVDLAAARDGSSRLFVVEQAGLVRSFQNRAEVKATEVFLDIRERVSREHNEEGLLGFALPQRFPDDPHVYVYYSAARPRRSVIARFSVAEGRADTDSEEILLTIDQPYGNHNGGQLGFGPDGYLYIALGDGGAANDPHGHGQNRSTLLGSILRIDVSGAEGKRKYRIPRDNPFVGNRQGFREEIYAYGLRNPWRFSWDPATGLLWTGDVGQNRYEEIDIIRRGGNYGWNVMEAEHCFPPAASCDDHGSLAPVHSYPHSEGISITAGHVYRGPDAKSLQGRFIFADFGSGRVWALPADASAHGTLERQLLVDSRLPIAAFGTDADNRLYACAFDGGLYVLSEY